MVYAIVLAGGTGTRLGGDIPKQYIKVNDKPIIQFCLDTMEKHERVDKIIVVASEEWRTFVQKCVNQNNISKFIGFADAGESRQHSILNGMRIAKQLGGMDDDIVIIHDAARPNVTNTIIDGCIDSLAYADGAMPVITVKDTVYYSENGKSIGQLLNRDRLFAGQAPESFRLGPYYAINDEMSDEELRNVRGSSEIAYRKGLKVELFPGDERNYKITTADDLNKFQTEQMGK